MEVAMWLYNWREAVFDRLETSPHWDIVIVGGGITGAGVLREAARLGLRALLVERCDFAWGTSSRSSKLVHGGFRYLKEGKVHLTRASVHEREQLMDEAPGLIDPLGFLMTIYHGDFPGRWTMEVGLTIYDLLALRWDHVHYDPQDFALLAPHLATQELECGFRYGDAQTDDARLVLRLIQEAVSDGAVALNYAEVESLLLNEKRAATAEDGPENSPAVQGVRLRDVETGRQLEVRASVVVNATGAWADRLRSQVNAPARIRPLRGSHLIFPAWRLPVAQAVTFWHPVDGRPVFIFPWEGVTLVGTTDVDHSDPLDEEPVISPEETAYLLAAVESRFPSLKLTAEDIQSAFAGVRPVIGSGKIDPSKESRDHVVWEENGLITVTGGKLTTFRLIAIDVLNAVRHRLPDMPQPDSRMPVLNRVNLDLIDAAFDEVRKKTDTRRLDEDTRRRLAGRYGDHTPALIRAAQPGEFEYVPGAQVMWAELRWAARAEGVVHLDDLLLRRARLGLLLPEGGRAVMATIREICQPELGWNDAHWEAEEKAYNAMIKKVYNIDSSVSIPDWKSLLEDARARRQAAQKTRQRVVAGSTALASFVLIGATWLGLLYLRSRARRKPG
jgi:glycerol-3-phosphate dehydrogenase